MPNLILTGSWFLTRCLLLIIWSLAPLTAFADGCSVLEYLREKSTLSEMVVNPCLNQNTAGVGTIFQLHPGGRLWLKTISSGESSIHYQLICRNKSKNLSQVSVTGYLQPWIQASGYGYANCSHWIENKMECRNSKDSADKLFCALALMQKLETTQDIQRKTSVTMRGLTDDEKLSSPKVAENARIDRLVESIKPEINLCRKVYQNQQSLRVEWIIKSSGNITQPKFKDAVTDEDFAECVFDVIKTASYPSLSNDLQVSLKF